MASTCFGTAGVIGDSTANAEAVAAMVNRGREREKRDGAGARPSVRRGRA